jgi:hypothetical protein
LQQISLLMIRLVIVLLLIMRPWELPAQTASHAAFIKRVTAKIAYVGILDGELVGRYAYTTRQFTRFDSLRRRCSTAELRQLVAHRSPVVRSYAYWALTERPDADLLALLVAHRRDVAEFEQRAGCIGSTHDVAGFMLNCYQDSPQYRSDSLAVDKQRLVAQLEEAATERLMQRRRRHQHLSWYQKRRQIRQEQRLEARSDD